MDYTPTETFPKIITLRENSPPARIHVHKAGYAEVFGGTEYQMRSYIEPTLKRHSHFFRNSSVLIGMLWAEERTNAKIIHLFGLSKEEKWQDNADVYNWTIHNNEPILKDPITCTDGIIRLGMDLRFRRNTKSLEEYLSKFPKQYCFP